MAQNLPFGTRVRIKNTMLYNSRVGTLGPNSGQADDPWDYSVVLDAVPVPEGTNAINANLYGRRSIGVHHAQVERL